MLTEKLGKAFLLKGLPDRQDAKDSGTPRYARPYHNAIEGC